MRDRIAVYDEEKKRCDDRESPGDDDAHGSWCRGTDDDRWEMDHREAVAASRLFDFEAIAAA